MMLRSTPWLLAVGGLITTPATIHAQKADPLPEGARRKAGTIYEEECAEVRSGLRV